MKKISVIIAMCLCLFVGTIMVAPHVLAQTQEQVQEGLNMVAQAATGIALGGAGIAVMASRYAAVLFVKLMMDMIGSGTAFCWFCGMFETLFDAVNTLTTNLVTKMSSAFLMAMGVGLLFSIAFKVGKMVSSLQAVDVMQFLNDMFRHLGRAIIATAFLMFSLGIFAHVVSPVLTLSLSLSQTIMEEGGGFATITRAMQDLQGKGVIQYQGVCGDLDMRQKAIDAVTLGEGETIESSMTKAFTPDVEAQFICFLRTVSASLMFGVVLGATVYASAFVDGIAWLKVFPNVAYMAAGVLIMIGHLLILIAVPFKLVDGLIRMAFVCALAPLWIVFWVFPATVGYAKKAWDMFVSTCAIFLCLSVVLVLIMHLMTQTIPNREAIIPLLVQNQLKQAADLIPMSGKSFLLTLVMCFIGFKLLGTATTLASSFVGSIPNLGVGDQMAKTSATLAKKGATAGKALAIGGMEMAGIDAAKRQEWGAKIGKGAARTGAAFFTGGLSELGFLPGRIKEARQKQRAKAQPLEAAAGGDSFQSFGIDTDVKSMNRLDVSKPNAAGEVTRTYSDGKGNSIEQVRDKNNNVISETARTADGRTVTKEFDPTSGNIKKQTEQDQNGNKVETNYRDGKKANQVTTNNRTGFYEQRTFNRDATGKIIGANVFDKGGDRIATENYTFDANGNKTKVERRNASTGKVESVNNMEYDKNNVLKREDRVVVDASGNQVSHKQTEYKGNSKHKETAYDTDGNIESEKTYRENGKYELRKPKEGKIYYYKVDSKGKPVLISVENE